MGQRVAAATKSEGVAPRSGCGGLPRCVSSLLLLMLLTFVDGAEGALAPETTTAHAVACVAAVSASVVEVGKGTRRGGRSKDRFGGRLTWWVLVASFFLAVLGGMAGVEGGAIPDCTYSAWNDRSCGIRQAVDNFIDSGSTGSFGPIQDWDVSLVTDMSYAFYNKGSFNADLSKWMTSKVTTMKYSTFATTTSSKYTMQKVVVLSFCWIVSTCFYTHD